MSYKPELQSNNADLQEILNQINAMPEGGSGGGSGGGGSDCLPAPDEYHDYITEAKNLYTGDYAHIAVAESDNILNVAFLMDDFTVLSYDEASTEFTAIGWLYFQNSWRYLCLKKLIFFKQGSCILQRSIPVHDRGRFQMGKGYYR